MLFLVLLAPILLASGCGAGEGNTKPNISALNVVVNVTLLASPTEVTNSSPAQNVNTQTNINTNPNENTNKLNRDDRDDERNKNRSGNRNANRRERDEDNDNDRDGRKP